MAVIIVVRRLYKLLRGAWEAPEFRGLIILTLSTIALGTVVYWLREPTITTPIDALYFTVITLTTVGYGDFSPTTTFTKLFTVLYVFLGLGIIGAFIAMIGEQVYKDVAHNANQPNDPQSD